MWGHLIRIATMGKGALVVGVAASAAMVSNAAEFSNTPSHHELPSATPSAIVSIAPAAPTAKTGVAETKPSEKPKLSTNAEQQPKANESGKPELSGVIKECFTKYAALRAAGDSASNGDRESTSAVCKTAIEQSGLSTSDFAAKYGFDKLPLPATTTPKTEPKTATGLDGAIKQCLADWRSYAETTSASCAQALAASGLSAEDFWKKFEAWAVQQPDEATTTDVDALVKDCFAKYAAKDPTTLDACKKAMAASGLNGDDFWNTYGRPTVPTTAPTTAPKSTTSDATYQLLVTCFKLHSALTSTSEPARVTAAYDACNKAIVATGLTTADFWAKYAKELAPAKTPTPAPTATPKPVTNATEVSQLIAKCLDLYKSLSSTSDTKAVSDACKAAIIASGMTSADFWTKYHPGTN
jgi:hypothetical protein